MSQCGLQELAGLRGKVSELSRRLEDVTRAYQQERRVSAAFSLTVCVG